MFSLRFSKPIFKILNTNTLYTSGALHNVPKKESPLLKLRQKTGLAYSLCREALTKHHDNVEDAEAWLKAQALAHGLQKATKVSGRSTREGLIGFAVEESNKSVFVLELNCETDFVAKNEVFKDLVLDLTNQFSASKPDTTSSSSFGTVKVYKPDQELLSSTLNKIVPFISRLGENIQLRHTSYYQVDESDTHLFGQIHAIAGQSSNDSINIIAGRFGAVVALKDLGKDLLESRRNSLSSAGSILCRHVIGFNPTYIELPDNIRKHLEDAEKDSKENKALQSKEETEEDQDLSDTEESYSSQNSRDDWPSMMDQTLIASGDKPVREFCKENEISVVYFNRFESGT